MSYPEVLTPNFSWAEAEVTAHRNIDNTIPLELWGNIINTARQMEKVRICLAAPCIVSSWYRCLELNDAIGSKRTSQHITGEAIDFISPRYGTPKDVIVKLDKYADWLKFDQLLLEHRWVHISFLADPNRVARKEVLTLAQNGSWQKGIV